MNRKWTQAELLYLKNNYRKNTLKSIAKTLKRSLKAVQDKFKQLDL